MEELVGVPKGWFESFGELVKFISQVFREIFGLRVFRFFGEALRQAGILIVGSTTIAATARRSMWALPSASDVTRRG